MEHSSRPTRAEASDVFNAVVDGTDAVMLSGETAIGEFPVEAVTTMRQICFEAEAYLEVGGRPPYVQTASLKGFVEPITEAAVDAAYLITERLNASVVVVATESGRTALALSNRRPTATILATTRTEQLARMLALCWGVTAIVQPESATVEQELSSAMECAKARRLVRSGDYVVLVRGQVPGEEPSRAVLTRRVS
jgi:pyruvate kinase